MEGGKRLNTGIGFFHFPKSVPERKLWTSTVSRYRRKGGSDKFNLNTALVCEFHFTVEEIKVYIGRGRKSLKRNSVPSIFPHKEKIPEKKRKPPMHRINPVQEEHENTTNSSSDENIETPLSAQENNKCTECNELREQIKTLSNEIQQLQECLKTKNEENKKLSDEIQNIKSEHTYDHINISRDPKLFKSATGMQPDDFTALYEFLNPGENCENI